MNFLQSMARCVFGKSCGFKGKATPQEPAATPQPERLIIEHPWTQQTAFHLTNFVSEDLDIYVPKELVDLCVQFAQPSTEWDQERLQSVGQKTWTQHTASTLGRILSRSRDVSLPQDVLELCVSYARHDLDQSHSMASMHHRASSHSAPQIPAVSTTRFELGRVYEVTVRLNVDHVLKSPYASAYGGRVFGGFVPSAHIEDMWCHPPTPTDRQVASPKEGITFRFGENGSAPAPTSAATTSNSNHSTPSLSPPQSPSLTSSVSPAVPPPMPSPSHSPQSSPPTSSSSTSSSSSVWRTPSSSSRRSPCTASVPSTSSASSTSSSDPYTVRWLLDARQKTYRTGAGGLFGASVEREPLSLRSVDSRGFVTRQIVDFQPHHFPLLFASNDPNVFQILKVETDVDVSQYQY